MECKIILKRLVFNGIRHISFIFCPANWIGNALLIDNN